MTHEMRIMGFVGDTKLTWETETEIETAAEEFERLIQEGYKAFDVKKHAVIEEFDPEAEKIILAAPISGG
jgi:hypothetical protein